MIPKYKHQIILMAILIPFLLANKDCYRETSWGKEKIFGEWQGDHPDIDAETRCIDCHDDIKNQKVTPSNHKGNWLRKHGKYTWKKFGYKNDSVCYLCHDESKCSSCHMQEAPANHTEFWKARSHGAIMGLDRGRCMICHKSVDFCERCHSSIRPITHNALWSGSTNQHCQNCHLPITSPEAQKCRVCHESTPAHPF